MPSFGGEPGEEEGQGGNCRGRVRTWGQVPERAWFVVECAAERRALRRWVGSREEIIT